MPQTRQRTTSGGPARALDPKHARIPALDKLNDIDLGKYALDQLERAVSAGSKWHSREAFYATVRAQAAVDLMHFRGCQLGLFDTHLFQVPSDPDRAERMLRTIQGDS